MGVKAKISGVGYYVPEKVLTNRDLEKMVDTNDEWISTRTGIKERRLAAENETSSTMGAEAAKRAIEMAGIDKNEIDLIIFPTITPDMPFPATSCLVQDILGIENVGTVDIEAACSGFLYALSMANAYIVSGMYKKVLVIAAETLSRVTDWEDRGTCILFGDGAGAAIISATEEDSGFLGFKLGGDGSYKHLLYLPGGGSLHPVSRETLDEKLHFMKMNGNATFKVAVRTMAEVMQELLDDLKIDPGELRWLIPHQANLRIMTAVAGRLNIPVEKVIVNVDRYGNTSAATIAIALAEAFEQGRIEKGDLLGLVAFGGGFTWASTVLKW